MDRSTISWAMLIAVLLPGIASQQQVLAETRAKAKISLAVVSQTALPPLAFGAQRLVIEDAKGLRPGAILAKQGRRMLAIQDQAEVQLPLDLPALVARNGSVILQYGDTQDLSHPKVTHLYWLDSQGKKTGLLEGYFRANAVIGLSDDGFTAVAGSRAEAPHGKVIALFSPTGGPVWERPLNTGRDIVAEPMVALQGQRVAAVTVDAQKPLQDHRILILDEKNNEVNTIASLGIVQKLVVVGQAKALFVQGRDKHALIQLADGAIAWTQSGNARLISPSGASLSPDGTLLFLLLADWTGKAQPAYPWRLQALDVADGLEAGMVAMPKPMAGTRTDLFGEVGADRIDIITDADRISVSISR